VSETGPKPQHWPEKDLRTYGRRRGRKLSPRQASYLLRKLPIVRIDLSQPPPADARALFTAPRLAEPRREATDGPAMRVSTQREQWTRPVGEVWLEIGFGGGEHLAWQAEQNPEAGIIGCEVFEDGIVKLLSAIDAKPLRNVLVCAEDARLLLRWLPAASIARAFVLFPDPWPKKRHAKRRLVSRSTLDLLARVMQPGAELRVATDIGDYLRAILLASRGHPAFAWRAEGPHDWRARGANWPATRYEAKALREGRRCYFLRFQRTDAA
jgi:tRNA (guanine-N7-)-methyltransferase